MPSDVKKSVSVLLLALIASACLFVSAGWSEQMKKIQVKSVKVINQDSLGSTISYPGSLYFDPVLEETYASVGGEGGMVVYGADFFPELNIGAGRKVTPAYGVHVHEGHVFICVGQKDGQKPHIAELDGSLLPIRKIFFSGFEEAGAFIPKGLVVGAEGRLYVVGTTGSKVVVLDSNGRYLHTLEVKAERFDLPVNASIVAVTRDRSGRLYFLSEEYSKVFVFDKDEKLLYSFGEKGGVQGKLSRPRGIAVDEDKGRVYITDYMRHAVSVYSLDGSYLFEFGGKGVSRGWFQYPIGVAVDGFGRILVADTFNHRIQVFEVEEEIAETEIAGDILDLEDELNINREQTGQIIAQIVEDETVAASPAAQRQALQEPVSLPQEVKEEGLADVVISTPRPGAEDVQLHADQRFSIRGARPSSGGEPMAARIYKTVYLPEFTFRFDSSELSERGRNALTGVLQKLKKEQARLLVRVDGHTDNVGSRSYNGELSLRRALAAARHIVENNLLEEDRIFIKGHSEQRPIASNATEEGRAENRRIELLILLPKGDGF